MKQWKLTYALIVDVGLILDACRWIDRVALAAFVGDLLIRIDVVSGVDVAKPLSVGPGPIGPDLACCRPIRRRSI